MRIFRRYRSYPQVAYLQDYFQSLQHDVVLTTRTQFSADPVSPLRGSISESFRAQNANSIIYQTE